MEPTNRGEAEVPFILARIAVRYEDSSKFGSAPQGSIARRKGKCGLE